MAAPASSSSSSSSSSSEEGDKDLEYLRSKITSHPDFPKPGVLFRDIFPALRDPLCLDIIINRFLSRIYRKFGGGSNKPSSIIGLDSRGFLFGPILALRMGCSFVPIRKQGKLPGKCLSMSSKKEYGSDVLEIQQSSLKPGDRVVLVDDLLATGGTLASSVELVQQCGAIVMDCLVVIELDDLGGRAKITDTTSVYSILHYGTESSSTAESSTVS